MPLDRTDPAASTPGGAALEIRYAATSDVAALSELAARSFHEAFADQNTPEDMAAHIARAFGTEQIAREIEDPGAILLLALASPEQPLVGYAKLLLRSSHSAVSEAAPIELERLYVDRNLHRHGVGSALMKACFDEARTRQCDAMWLGVWEHNRQAIAFYRRWGFEQVGTQVFRLGSDDQTDLVLARDVRSYFGAGR